MRQNIARLRPRAGTHQAGLIPLPHPALRRDGDERVRVYRRCDFFVHVLREGSNQGDFGVKPHGGQIADANRGGVAEQVLLSFAAAVDIAKSGGVLVRQEEELNARQKFGGRNGLCRTRNGGGYDSRGAVPRLRNK